MKKIIYALISSIFIQLPLAYFFISLEGLVLGRGFADISNGIGFYLISTLLVASTVILLIGLPIYFTLKHFRINTSLNVAASGFVIPAIILCMLSFGLTDYQGYSAGENYYGTYRSTFDNGSRTIWGWIKLLEDLIAFGLHGVLGATVFHKLYGKNTA